MCKIRLSLLLIFGLVATSFISPEFSGAATVEVFYDSFEVSEWNGLWTEDSQNDWFRSTQRAIDGSYSAEVDGGASDAALTSILIDLQGKTNATVSFSWYIERGLDSGEYLAFDVSTNGGSSWVEKAILRGNVDPENTWHNASIDVTGISGGSLQIRFRAKMSSSTEDADVDLVRVTAWSPAPPAAPTGLSATAVSSSQINLSWTDNSTDETGFKIERKTGAGGTYAQIDTVGAGITTYQNTGLSASTEYYYRVRAYNADGDSGYSNEANATTTLPGKFWEWECNVNPTTLDGNGDTIGDWIVRGQSPGTGFSDNLTTDGGLTVYAGADTLDTRPLYDATDADLAVEIKWKSLNDDTVNNWNSILWWNLDYTGGQMGKPWCWVNRSGGNTVIHMQDVTGGSSSDITVSGIDYFTMRWQINTVTNTLAVYINGEGSPRQTYNYTLVEENNDKFFTLQLGNGRGYIDYVHVYAGDYAIMPPPTAPSAPSGLGATTISSSQINLSWTDNSNNEDGFKIERKTGAGGTYAQIDTVGVGITTYQNTGLSASTEYYYRVRAYNTGGDSGYSNEANATTLPTAPLAPSGLEATAVSSSQINLSWTDNSNNEDGFKIERKTGAGGTYAQIDTVGAGITTYQNTGLSASTEYYYRVRAYNTGGDSGYSNEANATTT
ncbi:MAG: fibronectin type III domain-containing protein, partial [Phycisphaerae bacterium]|nr:fibronectin type III domain-containing protein [Phycisphaerae bacterium]